jgi:hypothetical protein
MVSSQLGTVTQGRGEHQSNRVKSIFPKIYCTDERNVPPLNRMGDPDDILASVRVENGKVGS